MRPLEREHGDKTLPATEADEIRTIVDEDGREIEVHIWNNLYFLERQLQGVTDERKKRKLRHTPIKVMAIREQLHKITWSHNLLEFWLPNLGKTKKLFEIGISNTPSSPTNQT